MNARLLEQTPQDLRRALHTWPWKSKMLAGFTSRCRIWAGLAGQPLVVLKMSTTLAVISPLPVPSLLLASTTTTGGITNTALCSSPQHLGKKFRAACSVHVPRASLRCWGCSAPFLFRVSSGAYSIERLSGLITSTPSNEDAGCQKMITGHP